MHIVNFIFAQHYRKLQQSNHEQNEIKWNFWVHVNRPLIISDQVHTQLILPPIVLSWNSWNWPFTNRSTRLDLPTADSPSKTSLNWQILLPALGPLGRVAPPRLAMTVVNVPFFFWHTRTHCSSNSYKDFRKWRNENFHIDHWPSGFFILVLRPVKFWKTSTGILLVLIKTEIYLLRYTLCKH